MTVIRVPHNFYAGSGTKVHLGYRRRGDIIDLACGMSGYFPGWGRTWLKPTDQDVSCGQCLRSKAKVTA